MAERGSSLKQISVDIQPRSCAYKGVPYHTQEGILLFSSNSHFNLENNDKANIHNDHGKSPRKRIQQYIYNYKTRQTLKYTC